MEEKRSGYHILNRVETGVWSVCGNETKSDFPTAAAAVSDSCCQSRVNTYLYYWISRSHGRAVVGLLWDAAAGRITKYGRVEWMEKRSGSYRLASIERIGNQL